MRKAQGALIPYELVGVLLGIMLLNAVIPALYNPQELQQCKSQLSSCTTDLSTKNSLVEQYSAQNANLSENLKICTDNLYLTNNSLMLCKLNATDLAENLSYYKEDYSKCTDDNQQLKYDLQNCMNKTNPFNILLFESPRVTVLNFIILSFSIGLIIPFFLFKSLVKVDIKRLKIYIQGKELEVDKLNHCIIKCLEFINYVEKWKNYIILLIFAMVILFVLSFF